MNKKATYYLIIGLLLCSLIVYDLNQAKYLNGLVYSTIELITGSNQWNENFQKVEIETIYSVQNQPAYFYKSKGKKPRPLVVSLHTWGGDFSQPDALSRLCLENNINYIHPNFNGPNNNLNSCCSDMVIGQIDEAINYAIENANVDQQSINVIGLSGGGYTAFCHYLLSKFPVAKYQSWVGISDLETWYYQSKSQENAIWKDILACTGSKDSLKTFEANKRSPLHMPLNLNSSKKSILDIYTGIHDGNRGTVPITHSINLYNKIVSNLYESEPHRMVSIEETLYMLENRRAMGKYGTIGGREVVFAKNNAKISLYVFDGEHEILPEHAISGALKKSAD